MRRLGLGSAPDAVIIIGNSLTGRALMLVPCEPPMNLPIPVCVRAPGRRVSITSVKGALGFIDGLPAELMRLPRWTFARALFLEVERTRKSRDMNPAVRQFRQALSNEKWLDEAKEAIN